MAKPKPAAEARASQPARAQRKIRNFRLTPDLLDRLVTAAAQDSRSVSLEIETRLEDVQRC